MRRGTYSLTETLNCPDGQIEWTRSGTWYYDPGCMYLRNGDPGYPPESGIEDDEPHDVWWCPDEGPNLKVADMPPAFQLMVAEWIERYQETNCPEFHDEPDDRY